MKNAIVFLFGLVIHFGVCQSIPYADQLTFTKADYLKNFNEIHFTVKKNYPHFESKAIDPNILYANYSSKIENASSNEEYVSFLLSYFSDLKNSHSNIYFQQYFINASARLIEGRLLISSGADFAAVGVKRNDEIVTIDGVPALSWIEREKAYVCASTDADRTMRAVWRVFRNEFQVNRTFELRTDAGTKTLEIKFGKTPQITSASSSFKNVTVDTLGNIGYIAINSMSDNVVAEFRQALKNIGDFPNLIVDIRANGGGRSSNAEAITSFLIKNKIRACVSRRWIKPGKGCYQGKILLLIGTYTFSAAESFALDLLESGDVTLMGVPTGGDTGNRPKMFSTSSGFVYRIPTRKPSQVSFKGFPMEGTGIPPHILVERTLKDYLSGRDTVLEAAKKFFASAN